MIEWMIYDLQLNVVYRNIAPIYTTWIVVFMNRHTDSIKLSDTTFLNVVTLTYNRFFLDPAQYLCFGLQTSKIHNIYIYYSKYLHQDPYI